MRGYSLSKEDYLLRLRKIEGQVRGLQRMIEEEAYCIDILTQLSSVSAALQSFGVRLVDEHIRHCVVGATSTDDEGTRDAKVTEAVAAVERLVRI